MKASFFTSLLIVSTLTCNLMSCSVVGKQGEIASDLPIEVEAPITVLPLRVLHKADYNIDDSLTDKAFMVLSDAAMYEVELKKYSAEFPAEIDFDTVTVVVATMGTQASGGYAVGAVKAEEFADRVVLQMELVSPADNCLTTQARSNPFEFIAIPTKKLIEFTEMSRVKLCE